MTTAIKTPKPKMTVKQCSMRHYDTVKECAFVVLEQELAKTKSVGLMGLADTVAQRLNIKSYAAYHCLKAYLVERQDLELERGRYGGIKRREF